MLPQEYLWKARRMDTEYGGVPEGVKGPVVRKLKSFPRLPSWVFGAWAEASPDIHNFIHLICTARLTHELELQRKGGARRSRMNEKAALAVLTGQVRRVLSLEVTRAQSRLLLDRVEVLGSGVEGAGKRRLRREQRAHQLGMMQGRAVLRRGEYYLQ